MYFQEKLFSMAYLYVCCKSDIPLHICQIHAFYFDTTPYTMYTLRDNVNTRSVWLNYFDRPSAFGIVILEVNHPGIWSRDINILGMVLGIYLHFLGKNPIF